MSWDPVESMRRNQADEAAWARIGKAARTGVRKLELRGLRPTKLPESLGNLTALSALDLAGNQLTALPEWLGNLTALTTLDLTGNQLTALRTPETANSCGVYPIIPTDLVDFTARHSYRHLR